MSKEVTLRLSASEAQDLRDWLDKARRDGLVLRQEADLLAQKLRNRIDCAIEDAGADA